MKKQLYVFWALLLAPSMRMWSVDTVSPLTICQAVYEATQTLHVPYDDIGPATKQQEKFVDKQYLPYVKKNMRSYFSPAELQSYASKNADDLNQILRTKGFAIRFSPFPPNQIGVLAIQDVLVKWLMEGVKKPLEVDGTTYDGVHLTDQMTGHGQDAGQPVMHFFAANTDKEVVVELLTQSSDKVYLVIKRNGDLFTQQPTTAMLSDAIVRYSKCIKSGAFSSADHAFNGVHFPMISYDVQPDVSWLAKMRIGGAHVSSAMQQVIFKMNEKGARAKAATGLVLATSYPGMKKPKETLVFDKPFLVWVQRPGVALPIFAGYMTKNYWKNPGNLD